MKTVILIFSLATVSLVSCKEEVNVTVKTGVTTEPVTGSNIKYEFLPWNMRNVSFSTDFNTACKTYLEVKNGRGGC